MIGKVKNFKIIILTNEMNHFLKNTQYEEQQFDEKIDNTNFKQFLKNQRLYLFYANDDFFDIFTNIIDNNKTSLYVYRYNLTPSYDDKHTHYVILSEMNAYNHHEMQLENGRKTVINLSSFEKEINYWFYENYLIKFGWESI